MCDEAIERFRRVHDDAHAKLDETDCRAERARIVADAVDEEREAAAALRRAAELLREAVDETPE